jgi:hypothetical protein
VGTKRAPGQIYRTDSGDTFTLIEPTPGGSWRVQWTPEAGETPETAVGIVLDYEFDEWGCVVASLPSQKADKE